MKIKDENKLLVDETKVGKVTNVWSLNVREEPYETAKVIDSLKRDEEVEVFVNEKFMNFFKIRLKDGTIAYAMKDYIGFYE